MLEGGGVRWRKGKVWRGKDLRAKWMERWSRKSERREDVQEVTDWSREKRKRGGTVSKRGVCIGSSLARRKECPRGEKTGRVRTSGRGVPPQAQNKDARKRNDSTAQECVEGDKCAKGERRLSSPQGD